MKTEQQIRDDLAQLERTFALPRDYELRPFYGQMTHMHLSGISEEAQQRAKELAQKAYAMAVVRGEYERAVQPDRTKRVMLEDGMTRFPLMDALAKLKPPI